MLLAGAVARVILADRNAPSQALTGLVTYTSLSRDHVEGKVTYAQAPPAGGKHCAAWQNCGIYTSDRERGRGAFA